MSEQSKSLTDSFAEFVGNPAERAFAALHVADDARLQVAMLTVEIGGLEADHHARKLAAITRLRVPVADGEKGRSYTAAEGLVNSDEAYNAYLKHIEGRRAKLEECRDDVRIALGVARLATALVETQVPA